MKKNVTSPRKKLYGALGGVGILSIILLVMIYKVSIFPKDDLIMVGKFILALLVAILIIFGIDIIILKVKNRTRN